MSYDKGFYDLIRPGCMRSASVVVPEIVKLIPDISSVIDVGCGEGWWLKEFKLNGVASVLGLDGHHMSGKAIALQPDEFKACDLSRPPARDQRYDLALSLEVAEHLPASCAERFVGALVSLAPVVVFSAAIPGQGGVGHVNEQWPSYWEELFKSHGYQGSAALRWKFWNDTRVENWYSQNLLVFALSHVIEKYPVLHELMFSERSKITPVVHPVLWSSRL